jgi:SIR2-like protein
MGKAHARLVEANRARIFDRSSPEVWPIAGARRRAIRRDGASTATNARQPYEHLALAERVTRDAADSYSDRGVSEVGSRFVMDANGAKAVWLLGSGFSAPLGGPLLSDLFRQETREEILPFFPEADYPDLAESLPWVQKAFHLGVSKGLWKNAEQYLAFVDDAYRGASTAKHQRIGKLIVDATNGKESLDAATSGRHREFQEYRGKVIAGFDRIVKRGLASEVSRFLIQNPPSSEPWLPYRKWVESLRVGFDTVVTLNYDQVIERASKAAAAETKAKAIAREEAPPPHGADAESKLWFGAPGEHKPPSNTVPILKLHGSVGWRLKRPESGKGYIVDTSPEAADPLKSPTEDIAIAAPGGTKSDFVSDHFESLWTIAERALSQAAMLFVIGYSFPDTDPNAQYRLLDAFAAGGAGEKAAHIVLGADITPASRRMLSLIQSTARGRLIHVSESTQWKGTGSSYLNIVRHPLGTQDFIGRHADYTSAVAVV